MKNTLLALGAVFGLILVGASGYGIGQSSADTVVKTETETVEVEVEVEVEKASQSCVDALDYAEDIIHTAAVGMSTAGDMIEAAGTFNVPALEAGTETLNSLTDEVDELNVLYFANASACRAAQ